MRILHRINLDVPAGVEYQFRSMICHPQIQAAFRHDVVYADNVHPALAQAIFPYVDSVCSLKRRGRIRIPRYPVWLRERHLAAFAESRGVDAILSWSGFARDILTRTSKRTGIPLLYREGGGAWNDRSPAKGQRFADQLSGAICNTYACMRMLQLKWNYLGSARICRVGVRPELLAAADVRIRQPLRGRPRIGVAARLASGKGVCLALYALKYLREQGVDVTLAVAGDGPERQGLRNLTARLGLEAYVDWLGSVQDMAAFYSSIDVLLHPTLHEALGNVTIEAGIFGVPVVATRVDGMAETVVHGHSGVTVPADEPISSYAEFGGTGGHIPVGQVFDPDTDSLRPLGFAHPRALATAVAGIVNDAEVHVRMSKAAESHVREHFSFEQYVQEFISSVHAFLGESAHNRETVT